MRMKYTYNCEICHLKDETGEFSLFFDAFPPRPKLSLTYVVNVYSDMSLSKGHLGSRGGGEVSKKQLKDTNFIFPMTNVMILGVFRTHAQKEYGKV